MRRDDVSTDSIRWGCLLIFIIYSGQPPYFLLIYCYFNPRYLDRALKPRHCALTSDQRQRVIQLRAEWCPGDGDADQAEEDAGLLAGCFQQFVKAILD